MYRPKSRQLYWWWTWSEWVQHVQKIINPPLAEMGSKKTPGRKMAEKRYKEDQEK